MSDGRPILEVRDLVKTFEEGRIRALNGVSMSVSRGEFVAVVGPSGCGKSTLLHLIAALDRPDSGVIQMNGSDLSSTNDLSRYRAREVGLVFQLDNLLPTLSASENVQVPMFELGLSACERVRRSREILALVDLSDKDNKRPTELSGGERQRVAIARALANDSPLVLADEPTGRLDSTTSGLILDSLEDLRRKRQLTVILVTHDPAVASRADRIVHMLDGRVVGDKPAGPDARGLPTEAGQSP
jgi:putative ABC transport system ATP-binding protein